MAEEKKAAEPKKDAAPAAPVRRTDPLPAVSPHAERKTADHECVVFGKPGRA